MTTSESVAFVPRATDEIETEIRRALTARAHQATALGESFQRAWQLASRCLLGGKLLRPRLLIGAFDALDGEARAPAVRLAAGVELLHFAFLLHDDVIDGDLMRRGSPNFIGLQLEDWRTAGPADPGAADGGADSSGASPADSSLLHRARSNAILVGDVLLTTAHQVFAGQQLPEGAASRLLEQLDRAVMESVSGELTDVALSGGHVRSELAGVVEMSRQKTATYSFELPLRSAAILAGAAADVENRLGEVGRLLGLAFQLQDDLLSTFGRAEDHGKDAYSDLREGKETAIIACARRTTAWPLIEPRLGRKDLGMDEFEDVRSLLSECGAEAEVRCLVDDLVSNAWEVVSGEPTFAEHDIAVLIADLITTLEGRRT